jgi:nickel-dependent lactate racemase
VKVSFPYKNVSSLKIPREYNVEEFCMPKFDNTISDKEVTLQAIQNPIGVPRLNKLACGKQRVLIVADDNVEFNRGRY